MRRLTVAILTLTALCASLDPSLAQQGEPTVTVMQSGADKLSSDLSFLMSLAGKRGQDQVPVVQAVFPAFTDGVDGARPIRIDIMLGEERDYRMSIPISPKKGGDKDLIQNIVGYVGKKERRMGGGLYGLNGPGFKGYLRILTKARKPDWGLVAEKRANVPSKFDPLAAIQPLVQAGFDVAATVENDVDGLDARREAIKSLGKELQDALKQIPGESDVALEIRRVGLNHQLAEVERIYAESKSLTLGWTTDQEKKEGRLALELTALEKTDLEASIAELAVKPSLFSSAARSENSIWFGRVNHTLDAMRQKHFNEMFDLLESQAEVEIKADEKLNEEQKAGRSQALSALFSGLRDGAKMAVFDGYLDVAQTEDGRSIVGALRVDDGARAVEILEGLKKSGWTVEINTETVAEVSYHSVVLDLSQTPDLGYFFPGEGLVHVATSPNAFYYAAGAGALDRLKEAVAETGEDESKNDGTFVESWTKIGPWIQFLDERRKRLDKDVDESKLNDLEKKQREERNQLRQDALDAFAGGKDTIHLKLQRQGGKVVGLTTFAEGILRFVGLQITGFAEKTLQ